LVILQSYPTTYETLSYVDAYGQAQVLPLPPEFITPQDGSEKQDCERVPAKRWLTQHSGHFSNHSVTYLGDDLYANQPLCQLIAETYRQFFIFVCKPVSHTSLYEWIDFLEKNHSLVSGAKVAPQHINN
jgi:hypothetical protein